MRLVFRQGYGGRRIPPAPEEIDTFAPWSVEKGINGHKKWIAAQRQTASGGGRLIASHALPVQLQAR
jgi:hypothetical protein